MNDELKRLLNIRYVKLHFSVQSTGDTILPKNKASAIRGGMGEMLLRANCVRDRKCENCDFERECLVRRIMYSQMEIQPEFMSSGDSVGYVVECEDYREEFQDGESWEFNILLFGKTICYFSQILNALYVLGMNGLGRERGRFEIISVTNTKRHPMMDGNDIKMSEYAISSVSDYVSFRQRTFEDRNQYLSLKFQSPLSLKYRKKKLSEFHMGAILESVCRRIYMLDCFEGIESSLVDREYMDSLQVPQVTRERHHKVAVKRYSNHKKSAMLLEGIEGEVEVEAVSEEVLVLLLAGELVHIGKNTSFGFGRYRVM